MAQYVDLTSVLTQAQGLDAQARQAAEQSLKQFQEQNLPSYLLSLSAHLVDTTKHGDVRRLAGLLLKNALDAREGARKEQLHTSWRTQEVGLKEQIHQSLLQTLVGDDVHARRGAAQVLAKLAVIELPFNEWPTLIPALIQASSQQANPGVRMSGLEALGFVCEELGELETFNLDPPRVDEILTAVVQGMRPEESDFSIRVTATKALRNALVFAEKNFERQAERTYIVQCLLGGAASPHVETRRESVECLSSIAEFYYDFLPDYIEPLYNLTCTVLGAAEEDSAVQLQAIDMWCGIAEEEIDRAGDEEEEDDSGASSAPPRRSHGFVSKAAQALSPMLLAQLTKQEEDSDDTELWNLPEAAAKCLSLFAICEGWGFAKLVMPYVEENIQRQDGPNAWRHREAALTAFGAIVDGPSVADLAPVCAMGMNLFLQLVTDPHPLVRSTAVWTIGRVLEFVHGAPMADEGQGGTPPQRVVTQQNAPLVLQALGRACQDDPRIAAKACAALGHLVTGFAELNEAEFLAPMYGELLNLLFQVAARPVQGNDTELHLSAHESINESLRCAPSSCGGLIMQLLPAVMARLGETLDAAATGGAAVAEVQTNLCGTIEVAIRTLVTLQEGQSPRETNPLLLPGEGGVPPADRIMELLLRVMCCRPGTIHEDALHAVTSLCFLADASFAKYLPPLLPVIEQALGARLETKVCGTAVGILGDVARAVNQAITPFLDRILPPLYQILADNGVDRSLKPEVLSVLGDLAMAAGPGFVPHVPRVLQLLQQAANIAYQTAQSDAALRAYLNRLRCSIFEGFAGMLHGLQGQAGQHLGPISSELVMFIEVVVVSMDGLAVGYPQDEDDEEDSGEVSCLKSAVGLVGDVAAMMPAEAPRVFNGRERLLQVIQKVATLRDARGRAAHPAQQEAEYARQRIHVALNRV